MSQYKVRSQIIKNYDSMKEFYDNRRFKDKNYRALPWSYRKLVEVNDGENCGLGIQTYRSKPAVIYTPNNTLKILKAHLGFPSRYTVRFVGYNSDFKFFYHVQNGLGSLVTPFSIERQDTTNRKCICKNLGRLPTWCGYSPPNYAYNRIDPESHRVQDIWTCQHGRPRYEGHAIWTDLQPCWRCGGDPNKMAPIKFGGYEIYGSDLRSSNIEYYWYRYPDAPISYIEINMEGEVISPEIEIKRVVGVSNYLKKHYLEKFKPKVSDDN